MMQLHKLTSLLMGGLLAVGLVAVCSSGAARQPSSNRQVEEIVQTLENGAEVTCSLFGDTSKGGISCDWGGQQ